MSDDRHLHRLYLGRRFHLAAVAASVSGGILMLGIYGGWIGLSLAELPEPLAGVAAANPWLIYPGVGLAIVAWSVAILAWIPEEVVRQGGEVIFRSPLRELVSPAGEPLAVSRALLGWVIISTPDEKSVVLPALYERGEELLEALRARVPKDAAAGEGDRPPR